MRTWRVGTISMGATLVMLGVFLLASKGFGFDMMDVMVSWWPIILIVLGVEILLFLYKSKEETPLLKYDFLSIIFVGILGTVGIGFAILQSTGWMERADQLINQEYHLFDLPALNYTLGDEVSRIVVDTGNYPLTVEGITSEEIAMFGTYEIFTHKKATPVLSSEDYVSVKKKGDTVYVQVKGRQGGRDSLAATLLVPQHVKLEVNGNYNEITIKPRMLKSNWVIDKVSSVSVQLLEKSDVLLSVIGAGTLNQTDENWHLSSPELLAGQEEGEEGSEEPQQIATYEVGEGANHLEVFRTNNVHVVQVK